MIRGFVAGAVCVILASVLATVIWPPGNSVVDHALQRYRYMHYAPDRPEEDPVLIVMLHGYGGTIDEMQHRSRMNALAREVRADVVYVQAEPDDSGIAHWNIGLGLTERNDVEFLIALIAGLQTEFGFSPERTFIVGESNGAYVAFAIACEAEVLVAGIISVIGTMSSPTWSACAPAHPVPVMMIHGGQDEVITADSLDGLPNAWQTPVPVRQIAEQWAAWNGATREWSDPPVPWAAQTDWHDDAGRLSGRFLEVAEMAHEWPRLDQIGISGAAQAWQFMSDVMAGEGLVAEAE